MLCITVELLDGAVTAGSPDDIALTGGADPGEWPLSPARLFAAFIAADGTGERMRVTDGTELRLLETAAPPLILADRLIDVAVSQQVPRYVPEDKRANGAVQEYPGRKATLVRGAPRLAPRTPQLVYVWADVEPTPAELEALRLRAARVGYLGRATSSVRVRVDKHLPEGHAERPRSWEPDPRGTVDLPVPFDGLVAVLDRMHEDFRAGEPTRRAWYRSERAAYRQPGHATTPHEPHVQIIWLRLHGSLSGRHVLQVTEALRGAVLTHYETTVAGSSKAMPAILHGHGFTTSDYEHVSWLALPHVGTDHATGRIHGLAVMLPGATPGHVVDGVRTALRSIGELRLPGSTSIEISPHAGQAQPYAAAPWNWRRAARVWRSAFPVVHERFVRPRPDLEEITRWCEHAGFPPPATARLTRVPLLQGAPSFEPNEVRRSGDERRPYSHLELTFTDPVRGPMVLGHLRHFGLGLMAPTDPRNFSREGVRDA